MQIPQGATRFFVFLSVLTAVDIFGGGLLVLFTFSPLFIIGLVYNLITDALGYIASLKQKRGCLLAFLILKGLQLFTLALIMFVLAIFMFILLSGAFDQDLQNYIIEQNIHANFADGTPITTEEIATVIKQLGVVVLIFILVISSLYYVASLLPVFFGVKLYRVRSFWGGSHPSVEQIVYDTHVLEDPTTDNSLLDMENDPYGNYLASEEK